MFSFHFYITIFVLYKRRFIFDSYCLYSIVIHYYFIRVNLYNQRLMLNISLLYFIFILFIYLKGVHDYLQGLHDYLLRLSFLLTILSTIVISTVFEDSTYSITDNKVQHNPWCCL